MQQPWSRDIEVEVGGKKYRGRFTVKPGKTPIVSVSAMDFAGMKETQVGGSPAEDIALMMLREIVSKGLASLR